MITLDGYKPNYEQECSRCGYSPTVDVIHGGRMVHTSDLCGCHFFSDYSMLDPDAWNDFHQQPEEKEDE